MGLWIKFHTFHQNYCLFGTCFPLLKPHILQNALHASVSGQYLFRDYLHTHMIFLQFVIIFTKLHLIAARFGPIYEKTIFTPFRVISRFQEKLMKWRRLTYTTLGTSLDSNWCSIIFLWFLEDMDTLVNFSIFPSLVI